MRSFRSPLTRIPARHFVRGMLVAGISLATAQTRLPDDEGSPDGEEGSGFLAGTLLPNGSILKQVVLPSYDEYLNLTGTVSADELLIVTREKIDATNLLIEFFNPDLTPRGKIAMLKASFLPGGDLKLLTTEDPVSFVSDKMKVHGTGLVFDTDNNRGFLRGPVTAVSKADLRTSMNAKPARLVLAAGATMMMASAVALPAQEAEPTSAERFASLRLTQAEQEQLAADVVSKQELVRQASEVSDGQLKQVQNESEDARITMNSFFQAASLATLLAAPAPISGAVPRPDVEPNPEEMTITSKQGVYLDAVEGLAIFLDDVELKRPGFGMTGADEVKIFMAPQKSKEAADVDSDKAATAQPAEAPPGEAKPLTPERVDKMKQAKDAGKKGDGPAGEGEMGDVRRIVATGVIVVDYKPEDPTKSAAKASARTMIYDLEKDQVILKGGSPWFIQDDGTKAFVTGEDAYIVIKVNGDGDILTVVTQNQEMFQATMPLKDDPAKKENKTKPKER